MPAVSSIIRTTIPEELAARVRALGERYGVHDIRVFGSARPAFAAQASGNTDEMHERISKLVSGEKAGGFVVRTLGRELGL